MKSKNELKLEREECFKVWFDRFLRNKEIEKRIEIANKKGFNFVNLYVSDKSEDLNTAIRMRDDLFIKNLEKAFPEFEITKETYTKKGFILGREYIKDAGIKIVINWR